MQSYQLDLLDEKALSILRGLEQLRIISLKPLYPSPASPEGPPVEEEPPVTGWKSLYGTVTSPTEKEVNNYLQELKDDWE